MKEPGFYIVNYRYKGISWTINIWADSYKDAKKKIKKIKKGKVEGKLVDSVSINGDFISPPEDRPSLKILKADI